MTIDDGNIKIGTPRAHGSDRLVGIGRQQAEVGNEFCVLQEEFPDLLHDRPAWPAG